jgi:hypothetical protein
LDREVANFISLPEWLALLSFLIGVVGSYFNFNNAIGLSPLGGRVIPGYELLCFVLVSGLQSMTITRVLMQAVKLHKLYQGVEVNIFNTTPLYALSRYASQSTVTLLVLNYTLIFISLPQFFFTFVGIGTSILLFVPSLILFFAPLRSVNQRMRQEKDRLLAELGEDLDEVYASTHQAVRRKDYARLDKMGTGASILKDGWEIVRKISTWPWEPESVRNLLIPLLFPVIIFLIQRYLGGLLGG